MTVEFAMPLRYDSWDVGGENTMQVGRIGIGTLFPNVGHRSQLSQGPWPSVIYSRPWPSQLYAQPRTEELVADPRITELVETRPAYTMAGRLGQAAPTPASPPLPLSIAYDDAQKMLTSAENIAKAVPACNMPILDRFRAYVAAGNKGAPLALSVDEATALKQFQACAEAKGVGFAPPAVTADYTPLIIGTLAVAGLAGFLVWKLS